MGKRSFLGTPKKGGAPWRLLGCLLLLSTGCGYLLRMLARFWKVAVYFSMLATWCHFSVDKSIVMALASFHKLPSTLSALMLVFFKGFNKWARSAAKVAAASAAAYERRSAALELF